MEGKHSDEAQNTENAPGGTSTPGWLGIHDAREKEKRGRKDWKEGKIKAKIVVIGQGAMEKGAPTRVITEQRKDGGRTIQGSGRTEGTNCGGP